MNNNNDYDQYVENLVKAIGAVFEEYIGKGTIDLSFLDQSLLDKVLFEKVKLKKSNNITMMEA